MSARRRTRGFTLLEMMIALAILGVLTAMSIAAIQRMDDWADPQSAASDLSGALSLARARAVESGSEVWFIVYEDINRQGTAGQGNGAYFIVEDRRFDFLNGSGPPPSSGVLLTYATFQPPNKVDPLKEQGFLVDYKYLDAYSMSAQASTVRFGVSGTLQYDAPFASLTPAACSGAPSSLARMARPASSTVPARRWCSAPATSPSAPRPWALSPPTGCASSSSPSPHPLASLG